MPDAPNGSTGPKPENQNPNSGPTPNQTEIPQFPSSAELGLEKPAYDLGVGAQHAHKEGLLEDKAPESIGAYNPKFPPNENTKTDAHQSFEDLQKELRQPEVKRKSKKKTLLAIATGAVATAAAATAVAVLGLGGGSDDDQSNRQANPAATASAKPGETADPNATPNSPSVKPSETPDDPEESINNEIRGGLAEKLKARKPFYEAIPVAKEFTPLALSDESRKNFADKYGYAVQKVSDSPNADTMPARQEVSQTLDAEYLITVQKELQSMWDKGEIATAIEASNRLLHTDFKPTDFYTLESDIPEERTSTNKAEVSQFLAGDVVSMPQRYRSLASAMKVVEYQKGGGGGDVGDEKPLSTRLLEVSHLLERSRHTADAQASVTGELSTYKSDTTVPTSANVINTGYLNDTYPGYGIETNQEGLPDLYVPMIGIIAQVHERDASYDETGTLNDHGYMDATVYNYYTTVPLEINGQKAVSWGLVSTKVLGAVK